MGIPPYDIKIGDITSVGTFSKRFDFYVARIDYSCATHPEEKGTIPVSVPVKYLKIFVEHRCSYK